MLISPSGCRRALRELRRTRVIHHHPHQPQPSPPNITSLSQTAGSSHRTRPPSTGAAPSVTSGRSSRSSVPGRRLPVGSMPGPSRPSTASSWLQSASGESLSASALSAGSSRPGAAASVQHHLRIRGAKQGRSVQERGGDASVSGEGGGLGFSEAEEYERVPAGMGGQGKHVPFLSRLAGPKVAESPRRDDVQPGSDAARSYYDPVLLTARLSTVLLGGPLRHLLS